jgi:hypothetical protein
VLDDVLKVYNSLYNEDVKIVLHRVRSETPLNPNYYKLTLYKHKKSMKFLFDVMSCFYGNKSVYVHRNPELITKIKERETKLFIADVNYEQLNVLYELCEFYPNVNIITNKI